MVLALPRLILPYDNTKTILTSFDINHTIVVSNHDK
jgi:hypothetical protein